MDDQELMNRKDLIDKKINELADKKVADAKATHGKVCPNCGMRQGRFRFFLAKLKFRRTYCRHTIQCIDMKYKDEFVRIIRMAHGR